MRKRLTLLIDADDTILDFDLAETTAISELFLELQIIDLPNVVNEYKKCNKRVWEEYELGVIPRERIGTLRYERLFKNYGITNIDPQYATNRYWEYLSCQGQLLNGAIDMLKELSKYHDLYMVTNGEKSVQEGRLSFSNVKSFFKDVFISQAIGLKKPDREYFDYIENKIGAFDRNNTYIIGDSLSSDIKGGINANINTIWFNLKHKVIDENITPNYIVYNFQELIKLIDKLSEY